MTRTRESRELEDLLADIELHLPDFSWLVRRAGIHEEQGNPDKLPYFANVRRGDDVFAVYSATPFLALFEAYHDALRRRQ